MHIPIRFRFVCTGAVGLIALIGLSHSSLGQIAVTTEQFKTQPGFVAELVYAVPQEQGSWVSLTNERNGRLIASDQNGRLYRITVAEIGFSKGDPADPPAAVTTDVELIPLEIGFAHGLLYAFDSLYVVAHESRPFKKPAGLYRVRDTDGDDQYDSVELLRKFDGGGEHGPHAVILGPDKQSLYICAGNHTRTPKPEKFRMSQRWDEDQIIKRYPDAGGHAVGVMAPGGWICKTDPDGKQFELIATGFRNQYDIAFDPNGELFTYDADMEWDIGLPWYRPTRVCHVTSGAEFGWRNGSGKFPEYYPDTLPGIADVGPGSPTGVTFGTGAKFPARFQQALFIADWSFGIIYSVHLTPNGSSYTGTLERFCAAPALPVTDMVIREEDGALYFLIGGRGLRSALYRIVYRGEEPTELAEYPPINEDCQLRREVEKWHSDGVEFDPPENFVDHLKSEDRFLRFAARSAVEMHYSKWFVERLGLFSKSEGDPQFLVLEEVIAMVRARGESDSQEVGVPWLAGLDWDQLTTFQRLALCRAYGLILIRCAGLGDDQQHRVPDASLSPITKAAVLRLEKHFPSGDDKLDLELAKLLVAVQSPTIVEKVVPQLKVASAQEQQIAYALILASAQNGWTQELRESYFQWFVDSANQQGGHSFSGYIANIRQHAISQLADEDRVALQPVLSREPVASDPYAELAARPLVKKWEMSDFSELNDAVFDSADLENGKRMLSIATCYKCHRMEGQGGIVGPDITLAGRRFSTLDLLETLIEPSKAVSDQYEATVFLLNDGRTVVGRVANLFGGRYMVQENLAMPGKLTSIEADDIEEMKPSTVSMMPSGLLDTLTYQEIVDLLAYMKSAGKVDE